MSTMKSTPRTIFRGIQDVSGRTPSLSPEERPTHLAKVWFFGKEGPTDSMLFAANAILNIYGADSFDERGKYTTHATLLMNKLISAGNAVMCHRVVPADAPPPAGYRLSLDVLPTTLPVYQRGADGTQMLDATGNFIPTGDTVPGFKVKFVVEPIGVDQDGLSQFGLGKEKSGDQVDGTTQSNRFPIFDSQVPFQGAYGNDVANRFWAPTQLSADPVDADFIAKFKAYPFRFAMLRRQDANSTPAIKSSLYGEQYINTTLKPDLVNTDTMLGMYLGTDVVDRYQDLDSTDSAPTYSPIGKIHVYDANVETLLQQFYAAEFPHNVADSDFDGSVDEFYKFNLLGGMHSSGIEYTTYQVVTDESNAQRMSELSNVYCVGGGDGTMTNDSLADLVDTYVAGYADEDSDLQNMALYPESILYDSGFRLSTKYNLIKAIGLRKDIAVALCCHQAGAAPLTAAEESSLAVTLRTRLRLYPESSFYGTDTVRGVIVGRSGTLIGSAYRKELPIILEFASMAAQYMGAGNGVWDSTKAFDREPNNQIKLFKDLNVKTTSAKVRNKDWDNGLVWCEPFDRRSYYFPGVRTVYSDDTSVLTSFFNMMICVELEKIAAATHRKISGVQSMTSAQLINFVENDINQEVAKRNNFDGRVIVKPKVQITAEDKNNGFSWTTTVEVYAPNMKTVQTLTIQANRIDDLAASTGG